MFSDLILEKKFTLRKHLSQMSRRCKLCLERSYLPLFYSYFVCACELNMPRDISPDAGLHEHHLRQQSRLRSPGANLKSTYCAVRRDSVNNFVSTV